MNAMAKDPDITVTLAPCAQTLKVVSHVNAWMDGQATVPAAQVGLYCNIQQTQFCPPIQMSN